MAEQNRQNKPLARSSPITKRDLEEEEEGEEGEQQVEEEEDGDTAGGLTQLYRVHLSADSSGEYFSPNRWGRNNDSVYDLADNEEESFNLNKAEKSSFFEDAYFADPANRPPEPSFKETRPILEARSHCRSKEVKFELETPMKNLEPFQVSKAPSTAEEKTPTLHSTHSVLASQAAKPNVLEGSFSSPIMSKSIIGNSESSGRKRKAMSISAIPNEAGVMNLLELARGDKDIGSPKGPIGSYNPTSASHNARFDSLWGGSSPSFGMDTEQEQGLPKRKKINTNIFSDTSFSHSTATNSDSSRTATFSGTKERWQPSWFSSPTSQKRYKEQRGLRIGNAVPGFKPVAVNVEVGEAIDDDSMWGGPNRSPSKEDTDYDVMGSDEEVDDELVPPQPYEDEDYYDEMFDDDDNDDDDDDDDDE